MPASILSGKIFQSPPTRSSTPVIEIFEVPAPSIFAPQEFKKFIKSTTSGSYAQFFKFVTPDVKIAAIIKFSVPVTEILGKEKSIGLSLFASR